jgi:NADH-quinone oxidoreductase subunit G|tara:strand:+ start:4293 stop:6992 length:2700 start_codon:yes stop_codon:yes gene_type:complete
MAKITVDGRTFEVDDSDNLLEALLGLGEDLPYFCWHPEMGSLGSCRQCAVVQYMDENDERGRVVMSCMTPVTDGAILSVQGEKASDFRESNIENLMLNHPHDCPVCEEGGECHLQDMTVMSGHKDRQYKYQKTTFNNQDLGPFIGHEMNRCITCYRCVRFYGDYSGGDDLAAFGSRGRVFFGRTEDGVLENEFAGNLVEVCPTGVFTDKTLSAHYTRKWDLQSAPAVCTGCSLGCNITVSERYGEVRRVHNRYNSEVNGYFLCDRGRFGAGYVNSDDRIPYCGIRDANGVYEATSAEDILSHLKTLLSDAKSVVGIGSPRSSLEANFALQTLVGEDNFYSGLSAVEAEIASLQLQVLNSDLKTPSLAEVEDCDAVLILGEDTTNHAPRLALSIRQAVRNEAKDLAKEARIPLWQDAAVRKLAQDAKSPLFVLTSSADRLDGIGTGIRLSSEDIALAGINIANGIDGTAEDDADIQSIVEALTNASKPLIVTGSSSACPEIVKAAVNIATALSKRNAETGLLICTDEANTLAAARLSEKPFPTTGADVAIVLENDLSLRVAGATLDDWLAQVTSLVVIDSLDNSISSRSSLVLPAATFAEAEGTYINNEGRAQRSFGAFKPKGDIAPAWDWLLRICHDQNLLTGVEQFDDLLGSIASANEDLAGAVDAAPNAAFRVHGQKISRMTHRSSGRTAIVADVSLHEPKQPEDNNSALTYSMEGTNQDSPGGMKAYTWSPGWNSNQSISKYQNEISGSAGEGTRGVKLFVDSSSQLAALETSPGGNSSAVSVVPNWHIFGSDELTNRCEAIHSLAPSPYALLNSATASKLGVKAGDALKLAAGEAPSLAVMLDDSIAEGCVICPVLEETRAYLHLPTAGDGLLVKDESWTPPADAENIISSDRSS